MSIAMTKQLLACIPLFKGLPDEELERLANKLQVRQLEPDALLFKEGDVGDQFFIVAAGQVEVVKALGTPEERVVGRRGPGEYVGEMSLVNPDGLRTASVRSLGQAQLWEMTQADFAELLSRQPHMVNVMLQVLSARLVESENITIQDLRAKNRQLSQAYEELKAAQAQLLEKERLERELQVARQIQMSILPQVLPELASYSFGARIQPARAVGGDFYDLFFCLNEDTIGIFVGDVSDKGVPAAIFMARIHALLYAEAQRGARPAEVLRQVNRRLMEISAAPLYATAIYGLLDGPSGWFTYARAGHELPLLGEPDGQVRQPPHRQGQLLGALDDPLMDEGALQIPSGATLLLYTDGILDGRDPQGELFGPHRLSAAFQKLAGLPAQQVCDRLLQALSAFQSSAPQDDDLTLVAISRHAGN